MNVEEKSYINIAEEILMEKGEPIDLYDLFEEIAERKGVAVGDISDDLSEFYAELVSSAKFIYTGSNTWNLKGHQKIELWTKDGSYYNEYKEVEDPEIDARIEEQKRKEQEHQEMLERRQKEQELEEEAKKRAEAQEAERAAEERAAMEARKAAEQASKASEEEAEAEAKETATDEFKLKDSDLIEPDAEIFEEEEDDFAPVDEEFEEEEDFDEEEYLEIMDQYEDKYEK